MKKIIRNGLLMLVAGVLAVSCADYNVTDNFKADPDPSFVQPYKDLDAVKSYINREQYPNLTLGAMLNVSEFNKQELAHAAAVTNFDDLAFGASLMSGAIVNAKGVMNFLDMKDLLDHVEEIGGEVFGSPIVANANQADGWLSTLTAPIEIIVDYVEGKTVDYTTMTTFEGTVEKGTATIEKYDDANALKISSASRVRIIEGFELDSLATYTTTFWAKADKDVNFSVVFSGTQIDGGSAGGKFLLAGGNWKKIVVESQSAPGETEGYLSIETARGTPVYIQKAQVGYYPDNHRPQTAQEKTIKKFDLIDEALGTDEMDNGMYDLKHSTDKFFWQDVLGSENYAPIVSKVASEAYQKYGGDPEALRFFIGESGLENEKQFESLKYWINIWDVKGAKIDGINAKLNLTYSEDPETQEANKVSLDNLLTNLANLASTGKLIRLSNFDIIYKNAAGAKVLAKDITDAQRQKLADYYGYVIKSYMSKIPNDKQAGICKGNLADTNDPVGLWAIENKDWVRTATYKAFCEALSGQ